MAMPLLKYEQCPMCSASFKGKEIPEKSRHLYGDATHYSNIIGMEIRGVYDGVLFWQCHNCGARFHRFPEGHYLRERAEAHIHTSDKETS